MIEIKKLAKAIIEIKRLIRNQGRSNFIFVRDIEFILKDINLKELEKIVDENEKSKVLKAKEALSRLRKRNG